MIYICKNKINFETRYLRLILWRGFFFTDLQHESRTYGNKFWPNGPNQVFLHLCIFDQSAWSISSKNQLINQRDQLASSINSVFVLLINQLSSVFVFLINQLNELLEEKLKVMWESSKIMEALWHSFKVSEKLKFIWSFKRIESDNRVNL